MNALPYGLSGPIGTRAASTSSTALPTPSTIMSSRAENRCWWYGAPIPGAISEAQGYSLPSACAPGWTEANTTPVALHSSSIVPSR